MLRVVIRDCATADLDEIADHIARDSVDAAVRFYMAARRTFALMAELPRAGTRRVVADPSLAELRTWTIAGFRKYVVCYLPIENGVEVIRVLHGARDLDRIFTR